MVASFGCTRNTKVHTKIFFFTKPLVAELNFVFVGLVDGNLALPQNSEKMEYNFCLLKK